MSERHCEQLEKACADAWEKWQRSLKRGVGVVPPATDEPDFESPPPVDIGVSRRYHDCAAQLRACYEENEVPPAEERWPKPGDRPIRQVEWPEAGRYAALQSQLFDFDVALNALGRIRHYSTFAPLDLVIEHALYAIALLYYARIFTSGVRHACSIDALSLTEAEQQQHDRLIALRNKWLAHSVNALDQVAVGIVLSGFGDDAAVVDTCRMRLRHWTIPVKDIQGVEDFVRSIRRRVEAQNQEAYERLLAQAQATPVAELQRLPELSLVVPGDDLETARRPRAPAV